MKKMAKAMYGKSMMKKGGKVTTKKMGMGGMHMMPDGTMMKDSEMKNGGAKKPKMMKGGAKPKNPIISNAEKALMDNKFYQKATAAVDGRTSSFMKGGAKPKAMYGTAMKPGMMKKGGAKKK